MTKSPWAYTASNAPYAVFPLGGIGAGSLGIGADGRLQDWEVFNRPSKGSVNGFTHFAVRAERAGQVVDTRILHGPFTGNRSGSFLGAQYNAFGFGPRRPQMTGFPSFRKSTLTGPYPAADLEFEDIAFPGTVKMRALSPFIPLRDRESSMPVAMFEVSFVNDGDTPLDYTLFGCLAFDFVDVGANANVTIDTSKGLRLTGTTSHPSDHADHAQLSLATDHDDVSFQHHLYRGNWFDTMEVYWADISKGGRLKDRKYTDLKGLEAHNQADANEHSLMAAHVTVPPGETGTIRVALSWYVPNVQKYWISQFPITCCGTQETQSQWRNYYATEWTGSEAVADEVLENWNHLTEQTLGFRDALTDTTLPHVITDAVSANLSILKSATVLRLEDGTFYGFEGCHPSSGCCEGSCTHVWNYQQALPFLFPALERSMRVADFVENQDPESGGMAFRMALPKGIGRSTVRPCADGQFGNVMKAFRDWKLHGDDDWLKQLWPHIKAAIDFAWHPNNHDLWDPDQTGILSGRQHHTLDMELFGPSSWLCGFYLGALAAGAQMAETVGDTQSAELYRKLFANGKNWVGEHLFNGDWFMQQINVEDKKTLAPFVTDKGQVMHMSGDIYQQYWSDEHSEIKYQIGEGCAIDQVLAEWHARLYGLEHLYDPDKFATAVRSIYEHNFVERIGDLANPCRVFGMEEESGTTICSWPNGVDRPVIPLPYSQETMHGFEYAFGCQLMMIGEVDKGIRVFEAVRDRYQGHNRNPWNEIECGSNYARSMASYAAIPVLTGFEYDASAAHMGFAPVHTKDGHFKSLWSNGLSWGQIEIAEDTTRLSVLGGALSIKTLSLNGQVFSAEHIGSVLGVKAEKGRVNLEVGTHLHL
ncbi:GH116 family glycosyl-hydrolase [Pararhizobium sp. IMCC21322]|uniref:GH116 family glycosyl-hydrolase n=1 Tax=Pararhizobium sp. IMCC21322 TaxID=3067903 RepID=UPI002740F209|nr:GH116 family glycosyl-hydrolase [Pararhizobium sp. IMCC21322]